MRRQPPQLHPPSPRGCPRAAVTLLLLATPLVGCGYRPCGTVELTTLNGGEPFVDERWDKDADGDVDFVEGCGADVGAFGFHYADYNLVQLIFDTSTWDSGEAVEIAYDYLPAANLMVRLDHLAVGNEIDLGGLSGLGIHIPTGSGSDLYEVFPLAEARLTVLDGPKVPRYSDVLMEMEPVQWKFSWELIYGDPRMERYAGEDWIELIYEEAYAGLDTFTTLPPDYNERAR